MPDQRRGSGEEFPALGRADRILLRAGRPRRADRFSCLHRLHRSAVLRLDDREVDRGRGDPQIRRSRGCGARSDEYYITGIKTTVPFHNAIMRNADFATAITTPALSSG